MIVLGYTCVGKSTASNTNKNYIDLDSSFFKNGTEFTSSEILNYSSVALDLSYKDLTVMISTHRQVVERFENEYQKMDYVEPVVLVFPAMELWSEWLRRAETR